LSFKTTNNHNNLVIAKSNQQNPAASDNAQMCWSGADKMGKCEKQVLKDWPQISKTWKEYTPVGTPWHEPGDPTAMDDA
jgi:hypothetical protein